MDGTANTRGTLTRLFNDSAADGREVIDQAVPLVYDELRRMARKQLSGHQRYTLNTTALVDEAYLKLVDRDHVPVNSRAYFFGAAAKAMRQVLVDAARRRARLKRGGDQVGITLDNDQLAADSFSAEILELHEALDHLAERYPRQARIVECRFFGGMTTDETADALDLSRRTVVRDWTMARAWLFQSLNKDQAAND